MPSTENNEKLYAKGFNEGYLLSQHEPALLNKLLRSPNKENDYMRGLENGKKQHEKEVLAARLKAVGKDKRQDKER